MAKRSSSLLAVLLLAASAGASEDGWKTRLRASVATGHDSNPFKLSERQQASLLAHDPGNLASGRYGNMHAIGDFTLAPSLEVRVDHADLLGKGDFSVTAGVEYLRSLANPARSSATLQARALQGFSKRGRLSLSSSWTPSRFQRNYLADVLDPAGKVSLDERVYRGAVYGEPEVELGYRHRLTGKKSAVAVSLEALLGAGWRWYQPPFAGRDTRTLAAGARVRVEPTPELGLGAGYTWEREHNAVHPEALVLDEPDFHLDLNGDGDQLDNNQFRRERVDRSATAHQIAATVRWRPFEALQVEAGYDLLLRAYSSREALDPAHRGRADRRNELSLGAEYRALDALRVAARVEQLWQTTNRPASPEAAGDTADYAQRQVEVGASWDLFWP